MNPNAIVFVALTSSVGYLISSTTYGTVVGSVVGLSVVMLATIFQKR